MAVSNRASPLPPPFICLMDAQCPTTCWTVRSMASQSSTECFPFCVSMCVWRETVYGEADGQSKYNCRPWQSAMCTMKYWIFLRKKQGISQQAATQTCFVCTSRKCSNYKPSYIWFMWLLMIWRGKILCNPFSFDIFCWHSHLSCN